MSKIEDRDKRAKSFTESFDKIQRERASGMRQVRVPGETNTGFFGQDLLGGSKFDEGYVPGKDFFDAGSPEAAEQMLQSEAMENRAQSQTHGEKLLHGLGRMGVKTGTEFFKGLGYLGGAIPAVISGDIEKMTNNFWVDAFQGLEDGAKEAMPVYTRKEVEQGTLGRQIWSPEFWANEGADGIGFLLSAIATGGATAAITKGTGIAAKIAKLIGGGAKAASRIDTAIIAGAQTFVESAAETKGIVDNLTAHWKTKYEEGKGYDSGQKDEMGETLYYNQEKIDSLIGNAGAQTMGMNALLLMGPNVLQTKYLFGTGDDVTGIFKHIKPGSTEEMTKQISKMTPWKTGAKEALKHGAISATSEAWQELSQFSIENFQEKKGKGQTDLNWVTGLLEGYHEGLTTIEGQKSMFLGAVLGLGPGGVKAYKDTKAELDQAKGLTQILSNSTAAFKESLTKVYQKNPDGSFKTDKHGRFLIDKDEYTKVINSTSQDLMLTKMYQEAKKNKEPMAMKYALNELAIRHIYPYLEVEGGLEIWEKDSSELMELMDNDAIDLGFANGKEYAAHLKTVAVEAKKEYQKVKNYGPAFFGIKTKHLAEGKQDRLDLKEKVAAFKANAEYNAVRLSLMTTALKSELKDVDATIKNITDAVTTKEGESVDDAIKRDPISNMDYMFAKIQKKTLEKSIESLGKSYTAIFDKEEQQKAFNNLIKADDITDNANAQDEVESAETDAFRTEFLENLKTKGYNVEPSVGGEVNDIGGNRITLQNDEGTLFRIEKRNDPKTQKSSYVIRDLNTGEEHVANLESIKKLGLTGLNNILTPEEFKYEAIRKNALDKNTKRLKSLTDLIAKHQARYNKDFKNIDSKVAEMQAKMDQYREDIKIWQQPGFEASMNVVINEVQRLEANIKDITYEINKLKEDKIQMERTLTVMEDLHQDLIAVMAVPGEQFSFNLELKKLEEKLLSGDFELDMVKLDESIEVVSEIIDELEITKQVMQDTLDDLYQTIMNLDELESILEDTSKKFSNIKKKLVKKYLNKDVSEVTTQHIRDLLANTKSRSEILNAIREDKRELMSTYNLSTAEMKAIQEQMKILGTELEVFKENQDLLIKYDKLALNLKTLEKNNKLSIIKELRDNKIEYAQDKTNSTSPKEQEDSDARSEVNYNPLTKTTPFSTVTAVYEFDHKTGQIKWDNGNKGRTKNYKQAVRWVKAMMDVNLNKLGEYSLRFVNNEGLRELDVTPPSDNESDVYAVLYHQGTPYVIDGTKAYTGIAHPETYFDQPTDRISLRDDVTYKQAISDNRNNKVFSFTYKDNTYSSLEDLKSELISEMKKEYVSWKTDIQKKLKSGQKMYTPVTDVSRGVPTIDGDFKNNPTDVLGKIEKLHISHKGFTMKTNKETVDTDPGMVYAEDEKGQLHRLYNHRINTLEQEQQDLIINRILSFMALSVHTENGKMKESFKFAGKNTKEKIPIVGHGKTMGIMDYFINWGETNKDWAIFIGTYEGRLAARFVHDGVKEFIDIEDLFDGKGHGPNNVRKNGDPAITTLTNFLETKFLNVSATKINDKKTHANDKFPYSFKLPTKWHMEKVGGKNIPIIDYDKQTDYNDFVLNNYLYTNIKKYDETKDEIPNFVNQYAKFDKDNIDTKANEVKPEVKDTPPSADPDLSGIGGARPVFNRQSDDIDAAYLNSLIDDASNDPSQSADVNLQNEEKWMSFEEALKSSNLKTPEKDEIKCKKKGKNTPPGAKKNKFKDLNPE